MSRSPSRAPPLPIIDLSPLSAPNPSPGTLKTLSQSLHRALSTTGFLYLSNPPLTHSPSTTLSLARKFFCLPLEAKGPVTKRQFAATANAKQSNSCYRGYFPPQPGADPSNLKEGFDIGPASLSEEESTARKPPSTTTKSNTGTSVADIDLAEPTPWPPAPHFQPEHHQLRQVYTDLQALSQQILSLLATALGEGPEYFDYLHEGSVSTLRLLHYPSSGADVPSENKGEEGRGKGEGKLSCSPHTDSGILTLLAQDQTGGLEVLLPRRGGQGGVEKGGEGKEEGENGGVWTAIPPLPDTLVVNVGDLMHYMSGRRYKATMHRVRGGAGERWSVPFFFEPGEGCVVRAVGDGEGEGVVYGEHVREKMKGWVEFQGGEEGS